MEEYCISPQDGKDGNEQDPLVTAVLPTYNRPKRLERAAESVLGQTYGPLELLIIDDASDEFYAKDIISDLNDYSTHIRVFRHEENQGASAARNTGIDEAKGKYVAFLDDDDEWLPEKTEKQVRELETSNSDIAYCWVRRLDSNAKQRAVHSPTNSGDITERLLKSNVTGTTSTVIVSTELCQSMNGFDEDFPRWNDWDFSLRTSERTTFTVVQDILVYQYTWDGNQLSDDFEKLRSARDRLVSKHIDLAMEYKMKPQFRAWTDFGVGIDAGMAGKYGLARQYLLNAMRTYPFEYQFYIYFMLFLGGQYTLRPAQNLKRVVSRLIS
jgi:glycosyltransferase involved in cell wall biosynthesis